MYDRSGPRGSQHLEDMAKQRSYIELEGTLGALTFYRADGEALVKRKSSIAKERIMNDPNFKRTRENMQEFGGAVMASKSLRHGVASVIKLMRDRNITGRLTGVMRDIVSLGTGLRGERKLEIMPNKFLIEGFEYNKTLSFESVFYAPFATPSIDVNRSKVTWTVPDFNTSDYVRAPEGATHFKLVLAITALSDFAYDAATNSYIAVNPDESELNATTYSAEVPIGGLVGSDTVLEADLGLVAPLPATAGNVVSLGIVFYQEVNSLYYELASDNAMTIALIG